MGLQSEGCVVALRVSDGGGEHALLREVVLAIVSGLLVRSAKKGEGRKGEGVVEFPR